MAKNLFNVISGPKIEKSSFFAVVNNVNLTHDIVNILLFIVIEFLRTLILSSTLYVRYWGHAAAILMTFSKNKPKFGFYPPKWHFSDIYPLTIIYLSKWLIKSKHFINCGVLDHFGLFRGDFWCFRKDFRRFSPNPIFKTKWPPLGPQK